MKYQKYIGCRNECLIFALVLTTIFILLPGGALQAATHTIYSLPYTVGAHSADLWDTLVINGSKLTSEKNGIYFAAGKSKWVIKLDDDTLEFGRNISDFTYPYNYWTTAAGIYIAGSCSDIIIEGGYILHVPEDAVGNPIDTSTPYDTLFAGRGYNHCISARDFVNGLTIRNVREARIRGVGGLNGTSSVLYIRGKNILVDSSFFYNDITAFRSRCNFESTVIKFDYPPQILGGGDSYHFRIANSYIESNSHCGIVANADPGNSHDDEFLVGEIEACTFKIDTRNDQYPVFGGSCFSVTNGYSIYLRSAGPGSLVKDNTFSSGDLHNGGRGMMMLFCNGTAENMVDVSGNYMDIHEGSTVEHTPRYYVSALKLRQFNHYVNIHDNVFVTRFDTSSTSMTGWVPMGSAVTLEWGFNYAEPDKDPYHVYFQNNVCSSLVESPIASGYQVSVLKFESSHKLTERDTTMRVTGNYLYTNGNHVYDYGQYDDGASYQFVYEDTVKIDNSTGLMDGTYNVGMWPNAYNTTGFIGNVARDIVYQGDAVDTSIVHIWNGGPVANGSREEELTLERTFRMLVRGGLVSDTIRPVEAAICSVFNVQGQLVLTGLSNVGGMVSGPIAYYRGADVAGNLNYGPFLLRARYGSDFAQSASVDIGWTNSGGTDTLTLSNTVGTGEWGDTAPGVALVPNIISTPPTTVWGGQDYSYDVTATGAAPLTFALTTAPAGMSINASNGLISWSPTIGQVGVHPVVVQVTNDDGSDTQSFNVTVKDPAPAINSSPIVDGAVGLLYMYDVNATGLPAPTYSLNTGPAGMSINPTTGIISWTPTAEQLGNNYVEVVATNSEGSDAQSFDITVVEVPESVLAATSQDVLSTDDLVCTYPLIGGERTAATVWYLNGSPRMALYLPMEGGATNALRDYSGNNNHAAASDSPTWEANGGHDGFGALLFDGADHLTVPDSASLDCDYVTLMSWIYLDAYMDDQRIISKEFGTTDPYSIYTLIMSGSGETKLEMRLGLVGQNRIQVTTNADIPLNTWVHVAGTFDGSQVVLYIDGSVAKTQSVAGVFRKNDEPVYIGGSQFYSSRTLHGKMDDTRIYGFALSSEQIQAYNSSGQDVIVSQETGDGDVWQTRIVRFTPDAIGEECTTNTLCIPGGVCQDNIAPIPVHLE